MAQVPASHPRYRPWLCPSHSGGGARAVWEGRTSWSVGPPQCPLTAAELPSAFREQRSKGRAEVSWEGTGSPSGDIIHPFIHSLVQCPPYSGLFVWATPQLVTRTRLYRPSSGLGEPEKAQGGASPEQRHAKGRGQQGPRGLSAQLSCVLTLCPGLQAGLRVPGCEKAGQWLVSLTSQFWGTCSLRGGGPSSVKCSHL